MESRFDFLLQRLWAGGLILLVAGTWPLWLSSIQSVGGDYPRVSWGLSAPSSATLIIEFTLLLVLTTACLILLLSRTRRWASASWLSIAVALAALVCFDQHRLQPWVYQLLIYAVIFATCDVRRATRLATAVTIGIYFYSSLGKFDFQFVHTVGRQMVQAIFAPVIDLSDAVSTKLAFLLPATEFSAAVLMMIPRTRRYGGTIAIAMHLALITLFGPWALGHSFGVLFWNAFLASQAWLLFIRPRADEQRIDNADSTPQFGIIAFLVVVVSLAAPASERMGYWDHWTSWALYSPHNSRCEIQLHRSLGERLPDELRDFLLEDPDGDGWRELDLAAYSLHQRWVPVYPQARYQLIVANQLASAFDLQDAIRVKMKSLSDRWDGTRNEQYLIGQNEIKDELESFWLTKLQRP